MDDRLRLCGVFGILSHCASLLDDTGPSRSVESCGEDREMDGTSDIERRGMETEKTGKPTLQVRSTSSSMTLSELSVHRCSQII